MSFVQTLRRDTAADHDRVDALFGALRLDRRRDYVRFLGAHARALPAVEAVLAADPTLPPWRSRTAQLAADLAALGQAMPAMAAFGMEDHPARWGALYVVEGSRLGGQVLARSVPAAFPAAYLGAVHRQGEWRALLTAIDGRAQAEGPAWQQAALDGARHTFALYARALD